MMTQLQQLPAVDTARVRELRHRVREAMREPAVVWDCPAHIDSRFMPESLAVRKARAIALKLSQMPTDLWEGQLFAGSMTLEAPRIHAERGFPTYTTGDERAVAAQRGLGPGSVFGHIVPDYPALLAKGLLGLRTDVEAQRVNAQTVDEVAFVDAAVIALDGVADYAERLAARCEARADAHTDEQRAQEFLQVVQLPCTQELPRRLPPSRRQSLPSHPRW